MVGTTRFELATSPTPRVRSTRLSHVPTLLLAPPNLGWRRGYFQHQVYTGPRPIYSFNVAGWERSCWAWHTGPQFPT
jgi:hypothetical protein